MKQLIITLCFMFAIFLKIAKSQDDIGLYSRRYERLDIDTILASPRLVTNYVDCLLNKKPCPPEGKALKRILPEALRTKCGKCWPNQKEGALKVITALYNDYPKHYNALRDKWDPTGEYHRRFEEYIRDQGFNSIGSNNNNFQDNDDINQGQQSQVITQRPTRQGIKTTLETIIIPSTLQLTTIRPSTISTTTPRQITKRLTTRPSTIRTTTTTELPELNSPNDIFNRFGGNEDDNVVSSTTTRTKTTRKPARPMPNQTQNQRPQYPQVSSNQPQYMPGFVTTTVFNSNNHILNVINRLTTKLSNTADFVAGVLRVPQGIVEKTRNRHRVIWQNLAKNIPPPIQKRTSITFRLF